MVSIPLQESLFSSKAFLPLLWHAVSSKVEHSSYLWVGNNSPQQSRESNESKYHIQDNYRGYRGDGVTGYPAQPLGF